MNTEFWQNVWQNSQTGFTQKKTNPMLIEHFKVLNVPKGGRVFVPLCGKSLDILWFLSEGFDVVGVELSEIAATNFLLKMTCRRQYHHTPLHPT